MVTKDVVFFWLLREKLVNVNAKYPVKKIILYCCATWVFL